MCNISTVLWLGGDWALASNKERRGWERLTLLREADTGRGWHYFVKTISTHPPSSKVGLFVLFCRFVHWPSENKEVSYYYTVRSDDVKVLKSRWNFVTKTTTPGNNIYTLLRTFIAFASFISSKFQTIFPIQTLILRHTWPILRLLAPSHRRATKQLKCYTFTTHE